MPVAVILAGSVVSLVLVSLLTRPPEAPRLERFFQPDSQQAGARPPDPQPLG
jgi:hypothetical protein